MVDDDAARRPYPPAPWYLRGGAVVSVLRVAPGQVPGLADAVPPGHLPVRVGGDVLVGLALARYEGTLAYGEVVTAVLTRPRGTARAHLTVPQIWVTSAASVAGARALWAIPKERCEVELRTTRGAVHAVATAGGRALLELDARVGRRLLPRIPALPLVTAQRRGGGAVVARHRAGARVRAVRVDWRVAPDGPLGHLAGRRPLASAALTGLRLEFGRVDSLG